MLLGLHWIQKEMQVLDRNTERSLLQIKYKIGLFGSLLLECFIT